MADVTAVDEEARETPLITRYIACAEYLMENCEKLDHITGANKLGRKCRAELKYLKSLTRRRGGYDVTHLKSSNLSHFVGVLHAAQVVPGVTHILQPFSCPHRSEPLYVDVVAGQGQLWIKVIARKAQALHLIWAGQGQYGERDITQQAEEYVTCSREHPVNFVQPKLVFAFYNGVTGAIATTLRRLGVIVIGQEVLVDSELEEKLNQLEIDLADSDDSDSSDGPSGSVEEGFDSQKLGAAANKNSNENICSKGDCDSVSNSAINEDMLQSRKDEFESGEKQIGSLQTIQNCEQICSKVECDNRTSEGIDILTNRGKTQACDNNDLKISNTSKSGNAVLDQPSQASKSGNSVLDKPNKASCSETTVLKQSNEQTVYSTSVDRQYRPCSKTSQPEEIEENVFQEHSTCQSVCPGRQISRSGCPESQISSSSNDDHTISDGQLGGCQPSQCHSMLGAEPSGNDQMIQQVIAENIKMPEQMPYVQMPHMANAQNIQMPHVSNSTQNAQNTDNLNSGDVAQPCAQTVKVKASQNDPPMQTWELDNKVLLEFIETELLLKPLVNYSTLADVLSNNEDNFIESINKVNLDVTALITLVSAVSHGGSCFKFRETILSEQAKEERTDPVLPKLHRFLKGKQLVSCQTAVDSFNTILDTLGGVNEVSRATDLMSRVTVVPDKPSFRADAIPNTGKIKDRSKVIFGTGDSMKAVTLTANSGFVRAASHQGVTFTVFLHASRALTEQKETTAERLPCD